MQHSFLRPRTHVPSPRKTQISIREGDSGRRDVRNGLCSIFSSRFFFFECGRRDGSDSGQVFFPSFPTSHKTSVQKNSPGNFFSFLLFLLWLREWSLLLFFDAEGGKEEGKDKVSLVLCVSPPSSFFFLHKRRPCSLRPKLCECCAGKPRPIQLQHMLTTQCSVEWKRGEKFVYYNWVSSSLPAFVMVVWKVERLSLSSKRHFSFAERERVRDPFALCGCYVGRSPIISLSLSFSSSFLDIFP